MNRNLLLEAGQREVTEERGLNARHGGGSGCIIEQGNLAKPDATV